MRDRLRVYRAAAWASRGLRCGCCRSSCGSLRSDAGDTVKTWQAWYGTQVVEAGTKRNGKPRNTLVTLILVAHTKTDARMLAKAHPELKFVEKERDP